MSPEMEEFVRDMLQRHEVMTLATIRADGFPQASVVGYVSDGVTLYFVSVADAQRINDIRHCDKVALTIQRAVADWDKIEGLSIAAIAEVVADVQELRAVIARYAARYPAFARELPTLDPDNITAVRLMPKSIALINSAVDPGSSDVLELWKDAA
jgi:general stress protein 26